jgi:hypothetical protein
MAEPLLSPAGQLEEMEDRRASGHNPLRKRLLPQGFIRNTACISDSACGSEQSAHSGKTACFSASHIAPEAWSWKINIINMMHIHINVLDQHIRPSCAFPHTPPSICAPAG